MSGIEEIGVGKLTRASTIRRCGAVLGALSLLCCAPSAAREPATADWQPVEEITLAASQFIRSRAGGTNDEVVVTPGFLDPRLTLPRCTQALEPFLRPGLELVGRVVVGVRCTSARGWKVYLPVYVGLMEEVIVTTRQLPRGHVIGPGDIIRSRRDISALRGDFVLATADIVGHRVRSGIANGVVVRPSMLRPDVLVEKGQTVTLSVRSDTINIQMAGIANADGAADESIEVRNVTSGKIVEGRVRARGVVEVSLN